MTSLLATLLLAVAAGPQGGPAGEAPALAAEGEGAEAYEVATEER